MKTFAIVSGIIGFFVIAIITILVWFGSVNNQSVRMENGIKASQQSVDSVLANYGQKVQEAAQVPGMMKDDLKEVMASAMSGRYGEKGSQAVFQFITENYPGQIDPMLYRQIQQIIESGRNDFQIEQQKLIDNKRIYLTSLDTVPNGFIMKFMGFPKINVGYDGGPDDYKVIITQRAEDARKSGKESSPIQLR